MDRQSLSFGAVLPNDHLILRYQSALLSAWTRETFLEALVLARDTLATTGMTLLLPNEEAEIAAREEEIPKGATIPPNASEDLREFLARRDEEERERNRRARAEARRLTDRQILEGYASHLVFHFSLMSPDSYNPLGYAVVADATGFYRDVRSLLFLLTCDEFMPWTHVAGRDGATLPQAMQMFARFEWDDRPDHRANLLAALAEALGNEDLAARFRDEAFAATPSDAHEYLTVAQAAAFARRDLGRIEDAARVMLQASRATNGDADAEIVEILKACFAPRPRIRDPRGAIMLDSGVAPERRRGKPGRRGGSDD